MIKLCLTGMLLLSMKVSGQEIKVGDKVPAIKLNTILNYPALESNLSAFKDKLVILDFMATNCSSCLEKLPNFDSLQNLYGDRLQVFLVTYEKKDKIKKFLQKHPALKLPVIGEDTTLVKYFPHTFISHEVWIKNEVVKAITYPEYVTAGNIETVLAGTKVQWAVKNDMANFDYDKPLGLQETVTTNMADIPGRYIFKKDSLKRTIRISMVNLPVIDMYIHSYDLYRYLPGHILLEVKDKERFLFSTGYRDEWIKKNTFCFEITLPDSVPQKIRQEKIRSKLDAYFGVIGRIEKRRVNCMVLRRSDTTLHLRTKFSMPGENCRTIPLSSLIYILNENSYGIPVLDETGLTQKVFVTLDPGHFNDLHLLNEELKNYGLELESAERETGMLVITATNFNKQN